jgi:hypothetical protein
LLKAGPSKQALVGAWVTTSADVKQIIIQERIRIDKGLAHHVGK